MKTRNKMKKLEQEKFVIPKTVQNVIPIKAVYKDGIFLVGKNMYSKTFLFTDVNYYIACENEKNDLMRQYWSVINSFGNGVTVKLTINNHRFDKEDFEKSILMPYYYDSISAPMASSPTVPTTVTPSSPVFTSATQKPVVSL